MTDKLSDIGMAESTLKRLAAAEKAIEAIRGRFKPTPILLYPDPVLTQVAEPIDFEKDSFEEIVAIVRQMGSSLIAVSYGGKLGIAAPQVGIGKRIIIVNGCVMVNPTWHPTRAPLNTIIEGCYSLPHRQFKVPRAKYGWAKWFSIEGELREFKLKGMDAIVFQHELSHLDGKCCIELGEEIELRRTQPNSSTDGKPYGEIKEASAEVSRDEGEGSEVGGGEG